MINNNVFSMQAWSAYAVGALIGVLSWFAFLTADQPLGITGPFEHSAGMILQSANITSPLGASYFSDSEKLQKLKIDWEWMLVLGVFLGGYISSKLSGDRPKSDIPSIWRQRFGDSRVKRYLAAFAGGALMMFGARMAQGCTSGHAISGAMQFALSSWIFAPAFFVVAVLVAYLLYGKREVTNA